MTEVRYWVVCHTCASEAKPELDHEAVTRLEDFAEYVRAVHASLGHDVELARLV